MNEIINQLAHGGAFILAAIGFLIFFLTQMEVPVVLKKEVIHDDYDVVLLKAFFAVNDMYLPLSPTAVLKLVADDKLQFQIRDRVEGFSEWKENELKKLSA